MSRISRGQRKEFVCIVCGNKFTRVPHEIKQGHTKYCSQKCFSKHATNKSLFICLICGKAFYRTPYEAKRGFNKYCSTKCFGVGQKGKFAGRKNPFYGKKHTPETAEKIRRALDKRVLMQCAYCGKRFKGNPTRKYGKKKYCNDKCYFKGKAKPLVIKQCSNCGCDFTVSYAQRNRIYCKQQCFYKARKGENCNLWRGGVSTDRKRIRESTKYKEWRQSVYIRDNFTCQKCGNTKGGILQAHHKKSFSRLMKEASINLPLLTLYDACMLYAPMWLVENGITYCEKCHIKSGIHKGQHGDKDAA